MCCCCCLTYKNKWNAYHPYHFPNQSIKRIKNNSELCTAVRVHSSNTVRKRLIAINKEDQVQNIGDNLLYIIIEGSNKVCKHFLKQGWIIF